MGMGCILVSLPRASSPCKAHRPPPGDFLGSPSPWKPLTHMQIKGCRGDYGTQGRQPHKPRRQSGGPLGLPWLCWLISKLHFSLPCSLEPTSLPLVLQVSNKQTNKQIRPPHPNQKKNLTPNSYFRALFFVSEHLPAPQGPPSSPKEPYPIGSLYSFLS